MEPVEGISTSPSTSRPTQVLHTHQQHTADYVCLMVEMRMSLPMGEDWSVPLVTGIPPFLSSITIHTSLYLTSDLLPSFIHHCFHSSSRPPRIICQSDHIHSLAELLHADVLQLLEVALMGLLAAKLIDVLLAGLQSTSSTQHQTVPLQPLVTSFVSPSTPHCVYHGCY